MDKREMDNYLLLLNIFHNPLYSSTEQICHIKTEKISLHLFMTYSHAHFTKFWYKHVSKMM